MASLEITDLPQDMTKEEKQLVLEFIENGCPGILKVQDSDVFMCYRLYMSGKTYSEIAVITKISKTLIMFLSHKVKWMEHRFKHYENISLNLLDKVQKAKLDIANNLVTIISSTGKYLESEYNKYLSTNDKTIIENIDGKIVTNYFKSIDTLEKVLDDTKDSDLNKPKQPLVNVHVGMGASAQISQVDSNILEITDKTAGEFMKALATMKKEAESKN